MADKTWKQVERRVARMLGGERIGCTGRDTPDVVADWLVCEVKHRRKLPGWLKDALTQARKHARDGQLGIAVLHEHGRHDSIVCMSLRDFVGWFVSTEKLERTNTRF